MDLIPVIDVLNRQVVRGVAGRREEYRPIRSIWTASTEPVAVARALVENYGCRSIYLADLDAIVHGRREWKLYESLAALGAALIVDSGLRVLEDLSPVSPVRPVIGLETIDSVEEMTRCIEKWGPNRVVFSLDMKEGRPLDWSDDPLEVADLAYRAGVRRMILLDLARVGTGEGVGTQGLADRIKTEHPDIQIILGGGIRTLEEFHSLRCDGVLVASALHDGRIMPKDCLDCRAFQS